EDGRIIILNTGTFTLRTADAFDSGLYHCIGTNGHDADALTFRITVVDPYVEHSGVNGARLSAAVSSTLYLPCTSTAAPDAAISWVLPEHVVLHRSVRNKHIFDNGTLRIRGVTEQDGGYFRCVAANQYGVDFLVFQVLVQEDETTLKEKQAAVGGWEEDDGSGHAVPASAASLKHPLVTPASLTANRGSASLAPRNPVAQNARHRNGHGQAMYRHYRDKMSRRFRGHRRQFVSSARRVDPQRWAAFLEKTRRNSTLIEKQGEVATKPPVQEEVPGDEEETSGDLTSPEEEFMLPVIATVLAQSRVVGSARTVGPEVIASVTAARKYSLQDAEAVNALPSPFPQAGSSHSRRRQTYLNPTTTPSWESPDLSQISANGIKQPSGATTTSSFFPAMKRQEYSRESTTQHLKSMSVTPVTESTDTSKSVTSQNTVDKLHLFPESVEKISQIPAVTASEESPESKHMYFPRTREQVTPRPPLASTALTDQRIRITQDVRTQTPRTQRHYGKRRKISGRRRLVRPGRIPNLKEHRYNFGKPGSARESAAAAVQLNKNPSLPSLSNLSSAFHPFRPEAPLSSLSTTNMPLEYAAGTVQGTVIFREEENERGARPEAATAVVPLTTEGTRDTPWWKLESSAAPQPSAAHADTATHTACTAEELARTVSLKMSSTPESVLPSMKPGTSPTNFQRGEITWKHLTGNGAARELLRKVSEEQTGMFPPTKATTIILETTAAPATSTTSSLHITPIAAGGSLSSGLLSLKPPIRYGSGKPEEHLSTVEPHSSSNPATDATKEMDGVGLKPTVRPIIAPQIDTRSKTFTVGRYRGQKRKSPSKTSPSPNMTASHHSAVSPLANTATLILTSETRPSSPTPAEALSESTSTVSLTETPVPWTHNTPVAPLHIPIATTSVTGISTQSATAPPASWTAQSPTTLIQTTPWHSQPFSTTSTRPATASATSWSECAHQIRVTAAAGEKSHLKMEEKVTHGNHRAQPTLPAKAKPRTRAPAATTAIAPLSTRHPTTPPTP
ncbi:IGS10 protein, partial [Upupa epops]|nr:IGS10 protein [Upupa epops]